MPALITALMPAAIHWTARPVASASVSAITSWCRKVVHSHRLRWTRDDVFTRIFAALTEAAGPPERIIIDSTHLKAHRTAASLLQKIGSAAARALRRTRGGLNSKLHVVCERHARPVILLLKQGQMSDHKGAGLLIDALPPACEVITDRGYYSDGFRTALEDLGMAPCVPSRKIACIPPPPTTQPSTASVTQSKTCLPSSRTGDASQPDTTGAPTSSWPLSPSPPP